MIITTVLGSNRKNGNTDTLIKVLSEEIFRQNSTNNEEIKLEMIYLGDKHIETCLGCRICFDRGEEKCPLKDDVLSIRESLRSADLVILASPVYVNDVSGLMKNWIDRMAFICHRPEFGGKAAFVLGTTASSPTRNTIKTMQGALLSWGFHLLNAAGFVTGARMRHDEMESTYKDKISRIAEKILQELKNSGTHPNLIELTMFRIQQYSWSREDKESLDSQYWKTSGWIDPLTSYFVPHHANPLVLFIARVVGNAIGRIFQ